MNILRPVYSETTQLDELSCLAIGLNGALHRRKKFCINFINRFQDIATDLCYFLSPLHNIPMAPYLWGEQYCPVLRPIQLWPNALQTYPCKHFAFFFTINHVIARDEN